MTQELPNRPAQGMHRRDAASLNTRTIHGRVRPGDQRGKTIWVPTAHLLPTERLLEAHPLDYSGDLHWRMRLSPQHRLLEPDELTAQLEIDIRSAREDTAAPGRKPA
jgi:FAD synthase